MPQWFVRPVDRSLRAPWYQCDDAGAEAILKRWRSKPRTVDLVQEEVTKIWIDGGGSVSATEPKRFFEANGAKFEIFLRHVPFVLPVLKGAKDREEVPGCICFGGWLCNYILSLATRDALVGELERINGEEAETISNLEKNHAALVNSAPGTIYAGKCSCQSGKLYIDCCGRK